MVIDMNGSQLRTIAQLREFLYVTAPVLFSAQGKDQDSQRCKHISGVLTHFDYPSSSRAESGVVRACLVRRLLADVRYTMRRRRWPETMP
ncbi:MAG: hypothetical protein LH632_03075 [Rhodoferax sp.]|nr:hypothetical protein [Rhodoferax sp.]